MLALDDPGVVVHAMGKEAAARVTRRTVAQLDELAAKVLPLAYDIRAFDRLGLLHELIAGVNAEAPSADDLALVRARLMAAIADARSGPRDLANRLESAAARQSRAASHPGARAARRPMGLRPHDLVRLADPDAVAAVPGTPAWVGEALARAPFAVVRRCRPAAGMVPVGLRGRTRSERFAAEVPAAAIVGRVTPEELARERTWESAPRRAVVPALAALAAAAARLDALGLPWGPTGGVGFELATGSAGAHGRRATSTWWSAHRTR